jgi:hypothetical protein
VRWLALATGAVLIVVAFGAGSRVADTREGLLYEVTALLAGLAGVSLVLYGWVSRARPRAGGTSPPAAKPLPIQSRSASDLLFGGAGLVIAAVLVAGIVLSAGALWALMGFVLLLPMIVGCAYLCLRFMRAPQREWKIDLRRRPTKHR